MANRQRGEVEVKISGKAYRAAVSLGALAHLEDVFNIDKAGELDQIINFPTYNQMAILLHALINRGKEEETISLEAIKADDMLTWQDAYGAVIKAVGAANPDAGKADKGNEESVEPGT